jgi:hypothetical protein
MMFYKGAVSIFLKGLLQFLRAVHDNRAVPGHRFLQRFPGDQQESDSFILGACQNMVAVLKQNESQPPPPF